ncbi:MAG TPA: type II toxin-antitoxin system VapC family toxin [Stellaceae bacterium]|nr:type II toxin-antitoxin system VapC family toxin [Stellaceae bacterium]
MILIDTNILIDIAENDPRWAAWSQAQLEAAALRDRLAINEIVYAELSAGYESRAGVENFLAAAGLEIAAIPRDALFLAGHVFRRYRAEGGARTGVLSDFFIGAHAFVAEATLLTRDPRPYRKYFPRLDVIAPD